MVGYLDDRDLESAASALAEYIQGVQEAISTMTKAAKDCNDNLGSDVLTAKAVTQVQDCAKSLETTIQEAENLQKRIKNKVQQIRDLNGSI